MRVFGGIGGELVKFGSQVADTLDISDEVSKYLKISPTQYYKEIEDEKDDLV